jgi:hypothetical protein
MRLLLATSLLVTSTGSPAAFHAHARPHASHHEDWAAHPHDHDDGYGELEEEDHPHSPRIFESVFNLHGVWFGVPFSLPVTEREVVTYIRLFPVAASPLAASDPIDAFKSGKGLRYGARSPSPVSSGVSGAGRERGTPGEKCVRGEYQVWVADRGGQVGVGLNEFLAGVDFGVPGPQHLAVAVDQAEDVHPRLAGQK